jgi:hypothetical protein
VDGIQQQHGCCVAISAGRPPSSNSPLRYSTNAWATSDNSQMRTADSAELVVVPLQNNGAGRIVNDPNRRRFVASRLNNTALDGTDDKIL